VTAMTTAMTEPKSEATTSTSTSTPTPMLKTDRKKLKKLKNRVAHLHNDGERSGLLTQSEHEEYQALVNRNTENNTRPICDSNNNDVSSSIMTKVDAKEEDTPSNPKTYCYPLACPSINLRKKTLDIKKVEGVHHRDLLAWLLQQKVNGGKQQTHDSSSSSSKKRRRDDSGGGNADEENATISIPHWASVHNPATCEQVAVLEIHVPHDKIESYSLFLESCSKVRSDDTLKAENNDIPLDSTTTTTKDHCYPHTQIGIATKWFQGYMPKSMSESLLYFSNMKKDKKIPNIGKKNNSDIIPSKKDLIERLKTMVLSSKDSIAQGYPTPLSSLSEKTTKSNDTNVDFRKDKLESPDSISLETAMKFVEIFGVRVQDQKEEDEIAYIGTPISSSSTNQVDNKATKTAPTATSDNDVVNDGKSPIRVLGLDCEMVMTTVGSELARVTLIQFDEFVGAKDSANTTVLLDCLVLPRNRIVDYVTKYSGITPNLLEPISTRIEQVQYALASYLTPNDILVGHSLENDLKALHYIHPRVVDTSMVFSRTDKNRRFKFSLRHLSGLLLKRKIQNGSHCSEEDAQAALDLALLKAVMGDDLRVPGCSDDDRQSLLQKQFVTKSTTVFIGPNNWLEAHITNNPNSAHALSYDSPNDCKKAMLSWITGRRKAQLVWSKIVLKNDPNTTSGTEASLDIFKSLVVSFGSYEKIAFSYDTAFYLLSLTLFFYCFKTDVVEKLPSKCVLMVAIQGELQTAQDMFKRRGACRDSRSSVGWSSDNEETWKAQLESTRVGYVQWFSAAATNNSA
jgi:DNA polymerase III epsilon subunit-like protein